MNDQIESYLRFSPSRRLIAGFVLALGNFMVVLDLTIANVSVPHIAGDLGVTPSQGTWVITSYAVAEAICVPLTGWLAQRFGAVRLFIASMVGFGIFSLLCGLSSSLGMLVAFRIGQGMCGGPIMPMTQTLLLRVFPPEARGKAMGLWAMTTLLGPASGPIIGGIISDNWSWHWIFFINVPLVLLCTFFGGALLRPIETLVTKVPIDRVGLALLIFWVGSLQIMLDTGREHDWFGDPMIVLLGIFAAVGFAVFVIWELTAEHPIVNLAVLRHPGFTWGVIAYALCFGSYYASIVAIPQWLQTSIGYTATHAGFATALTALAALTTAQFPARLMTRIDPRIMVSGGVAVLGAMALWRTNWTTHADYWSYALPQLIQGFAMPFVLVPLTALPLTAVKPSEVASAAGLQNFIRTVALAVATSSVLTIWENAQRVARSEIVPRLAPEATQSALTGAGLSMEQARQFIANLVDQEATTLAINHVFLITAGILFASATVVWFAPRPRPAR